MKYLMPVLLSIVFGANVIAAPGGGHHKITEYDYHDYLNSNIQSKTFVRYENGVVFDFVWNFDRPNPNEVVRTEIATDANDLVTRYTKSIFKPTTKSFDLVQSQRYDPYVTPPALVYTTDYNPPVIMLTNAMVPGLAWGSAGVINSTSSGESYYTEKNEVIAIENVTVPAGTFVSCLKIHSTLQFGSYFYSRMDWYCPDMGLVKRFNNGRVHLEMTSVTYNE